MSFSPTVWFICLLVVSSNCGWNPLKPQLVRLDREAVSEKTNSTSEKASVTNSMEKSQKSAKDHCTELCLSDRTTRSIILIMKHNLRNKIPVVRALNPHDFNVRLRFFQHMMTLVNEIEDRVHNLWMSYEVHFHLSCFVNKQNSWS